MLLIGIPPMWPYAYYQILRWVVCIAGAVIAYQAHKEEKTGWTWAMIAIAILFNPIAPIFLTKGTWVLADIIVAILMFAYAMMTKKKV